MASEAAIVMLNEVKHLEPSELESSEILQSRRSFRMTGQEAPARRP